MIPLLIGRSSLYKPRSDSLGEKTLGSWFEIENTFRFSHLVILESEFPSSEYDSNPKYKYLIYENVSSILLDMQVDFGLRANYFLVFRSSNQRVINDRFFVV